jgi:hypothetical protein
LFFASKTVIVKENTEISNKSWADNNISNKVFIILSFDNLIFFPSYLFFGKSDNEGLSYTEGELTIFLLLFEVWLFLSYSFEFIHQLREPSVPHRAWP